MNLHIETKIKKVLVASLFTLFLYTNQAELIADTKANVLKVEPYHKKEEYFTQRKDLPELRTWDLRKQHLPDFDQIKKQFTPSKAPYGIYMWPSEFVKAIDEINKIGFKTVRFSGPWKDSDEAMKLAAQYDIEVLFTLMVGYNLRDYRKKRRPYYQNDKDFIQDFEKNLSHFLNRYGPNGELFKGTKLKSPLAVVEIWNEPNFFYLIPNSKPKEKAVKQRIELYPKLLKAAYIKTKEIAPTIKVAGFAGGGAANADVPFLQACFNKHPDIGEYIDILSTHPYNQGSPPEGQKIMPWGNYSIINNLTKIHRILGKPSSDTPIWYTELGWSIDGSHGGQFRNSKPKPHSIVPPDIQAAYLARIYLLASRLGIPRIHVMHLHDSDGFNAGIMHRDGFTWRPAAYATQFLIKHLPFPKILNIRSEGENHSYIFDYDSNHKDSNSSPYIIAWNALGPKVVQLKVNKERLKVYDLVGNLREMKSQNGILEIEIGPYPIYIEH